MSKARMGEQLLAPPTYDDFLVLQDTVEALSDARGARVKRSYTAMFVRIERLYADLDFLTWPWLIKRASIKLRQHPEQNDERLVCILTDLTLNAITVGQGIRHTYVLGAHDGAVDEYWHSVSAVPKLITPAMHPSATDGELESYQEGERLLRTQFDGEMELNAEECGELFDRLANLIR
jgi:hypothetical protein